jgi:hypothetical protein
MRKIFMVGVCVVAFASVASAFIWFERQVNINGKPFAKAVVVNGALAMSVQEFAKGVGALTLEPAFRLQGNQLVAVAPGLDRAGKGKEKWQPNTLFSVRKAGVVSTHVFMFNGKTLIPFADVVSAFGIANWTGPVTSRSSEPINLNVAVNGDGIVGVQH